MVGLIKDEDLEQAEESFPGIRQFFAALNPKPQTFLELLARFERWIGPREADTPRAANR
jgi:hypothetical protein